MVKLTCQRPVARPVTGGVARFLMAISISAALLVGATTAQASRLMELVPDAEKVGEATFSVMFFDIYTAALWAPKGSYSRSGPFALQINYLIDADADRIISQTVKELRRQKAGSKPQLEAWKTLMESHFVDLKENDVANIVFTEEGTLKMWNNDDAAVEIADRRFARVFMNIWLGKRARDKEFQAELMGLGK